MISVEAPDVVIRIAVADPGGKRGKFRRSHACVGADLFRVDFIKVAFGNQCSVLSVKEREKLQLVLPGSFVSCLCSFCIDITGHPLLKSLALCCPQIYDKCCIP